MDVDLLDLRKASTVKQMQVIANGRLLYCRDEAACGAFEDLTYSKNARLNEERDAIVLDFLRAAEAAIDAVMHVVRVRKLGIPQRSRNAVVLMEKNGLLEAALSRWMQGTVGFRNIVHSYQEISLPILRSILDRLANFLYQAKRILFEVLNRRSQRRSYNWKGFAELLKAFPLQKPRTCHAF